MKAARTGRAMASVLAFATLPDLDSLRSGSRAIAAAWRDARLVTTDGLGHRRILRDPTVVAEVVAFIG